MFRSSHRLCSACSHRFFSVLANGTITPTEFPRHTSKFPPRTCHRSNAVSVARTFTTDNALKSSIENDQYQRDDQARESAQTESIVRQARQLFGETLPENFLSKEEYLIYERLYGPPSATTLPEDVDLLVGKGAFEVKEGEEVDAEGSLPPNVLLRENKDGNLEQVVFGDESGEDSKLARELDESEEMEQLEEEFEPFEEAEDWADPNIALEELMEKAKILKAQEGLEGANEEILRDREAQEEFLYRVDILREQNAARRKDEPPQEVEVRRNSGSEMADAQDFVREEEDDLDDAVEDEFDEYDSGITVRSHPLTKFGRFGTSPSTIQLPKDSLVNPTSALFADASNKHLKEVAQQTFGGKGLPRSTATFLRPNLRQESIPLEASHGRMGEMEANAYLAAIYPGAFASTTSALVEVRKRLGSNWLRSLMSQPDGPRILDAGSGGAAVLAWREVIKAEYKSMHPDSSLETERLPFGRSTVVTGSHALRHRASTLLDNTSFIPRLPDYDPSRDHPSLESSNPQARKQYDIIIAPYTLWSLREDHTRKFHLQNLWSLLHPRSGVLILIEKGIPRGFELIAAARETLLQHHISSPGATSTLHPIDPANPNRFSHKESGMIIAPCTNHGKCPMYITAGAAKGRKDFCRFNQRFIRPPYLQRILGESEKNHEDISFSYVALQRGRDLREEESFVQGTAAADAASTLR